MKRLLLVILSLIVIIIMESSWARDEFQLQQLLPEKIEARDTPNDDGSSVLVVWSKSEAEEMAPENVQYVVLQADSPDKRFEPVKYVGVKENLCSDNPKYFGFSEKNKHWHFAELFVPMNKEFFFKVGVTDGTTTITGAQIVSAQARPNLIAWHKLNNFVILIMMFAFVILFYNLAKKNPNMFIRKIAGLEAIDEAVGRATEMGKPIMYLTGYYDISEISTICSVNILAHVASKAAQYRTRIIVPSKWPVAMSVCQEVVREAYTNAGRPDEYNPNDIFFIAGEQFSYTAAVDGLMMREKPAANFFLGTFAAESLLLAEAGSMTGAIQIAGTDSTYQIPFFVVACDYCLIGEELYAASAYLSREPRLLGTLKTADTGKIIMTILLFIGALMISFHEWAPSEIFMYIKHFFTVL
ncbi:hypothetical protein J7M23_02290 [Candidatus Sumerlaeota bacterium]|nr:hypothetical protein [Candidatus Sumerlaeota bacterium]